MSRPAKIWIGVGAGVLLAVIYALGMLLWLSNQPPVLSRSKEKDPLSGYPLQVRLNPVRDRSPERSAEKVLYAMSDGKCRQQLAGWFKDYRWHYAKFVCDSEQQHPIVSWSLFDREEQPPLVILQYHAKRKDGDNTYEENLWITTQQQAAGTWEMTKYGAMY